ncbi:ubiquitin [Tieghemostelium lacteum]|uniref:Ubiquitin n=1 Tax=Tieghemostelium lacteum TaxID=361077 RepID=A0A151ZGG9_TIELA|nr:ubiquitin [Tieghemostelium lacteum]|eukprot:KYQ93025.1 ubiquitin [Tieghemostelium lacteum]
MNQLLKTALQEILGVKIVDDLPNQDTSYIMNSQPPGENGTIEFKDYSQLIHGIPSNRNDNVTMTSEMTNILNSFSFVDNGNNNNNNNNLIMINFKNVSNGSLKSLLVDKTKQISTVKEEVVKEFAINSGEIYLISGGKQLENTKSLEELTVTADSTLYVVPKSIKIQLVNVLDPMHDYDFTYVLPAMDRGQHYRGKKEYVRPCGFYRFALQVFNRFPPNNKWLRTDDQSWPVSYHPSLAKSDQIELKEMLNLADSTTVVTCQDVNSIIPFCRRFQYNNETYIICFQNRINPDTLVEINSPVGTFYQSATSDDVRPYAICIKKL